MIKFCPNCYKNHINHSGCNNGYYWCLQEDVDTCWIDGCNQTLINIDFPATDFKILTEVSSDLSFYKAMIDLHEKDIIEYELKMGQFRNQAEQQKSIQNVQSRQESNVPKCPRCGSTQIQMVPRRFSLLTGFATNKTDRVCVNCKYKW